MTEWISVEDRLPDKIENILVLVDWQLVVGFSLEAGCAYVPYTRETLIYFLPRVIDGSIFGVGKWRMPPKWKEPTHWMPIHELPKEKDD